MQDTTLTACIAVRSEQHGSYGYRAAYVYRVENGKWIKGEQLFQTTSRAKSKFARLLAEESTRLGLPVLPVVHNQKVATS